MPVVTYTSQQNEDKISNSRSLLHKIQSAQQKAQDETKNHYSLVGARHRKTHAYKLPLLANI